MILIIDSGATNSTWKFLEENRTEGHHRLPGINLSTSSLDQMEFPKNLKINEKVAKIFFLGAGVGDKERENILKEKLGTHFPNSEGIYIGSDLHSAGLALSFNERSVVSIIGTGSNCCVFDQTRIVQKVNNLGFILGDEGSGFAMGRRILQDYFYDKLSPPDRTVFKSRYNITRDDLIRKIYIEESRVNTHVASYSKFLMHCSEEYRNEVAIDILNDFFETQLEQFSEYKDLNHHFSGSVSWHFQDRIRELCLKYQLKIGNIIQNPIDSLTYSKLKQIQI